MNSKNITALIMALVLVALLAVLALGDAGLASTTYTSPPGPPTLTATPTKSQLGPTVTLVRPTNTPCIFWLPFMSNYD